MNDPLIPIGRQPWRIALALMIFTGLFAMVTWRLQQLQVVQSGALTELGERESTRRITIQAPRGDILDVHGVPLAVSVGKWAVYGDPTMMDDRLRATVELSRLLGLRREVLRRRFEGHADGVRLIGGLEDGVADQVRHLHLTGISLRREFERVYPEGSIASHLLGYLHSDGNGGGGIEAEFNRILTGTPGSQTISVDAVGDPSLINGASLEARPGASVELTIDETIQKQLELDVAQAAEAHRPRNIAALVIRPTTGEILAMASWPTFDIRDPSTITKANERNNAIAFVYEPGSVMKPLVAGAAVAEGLTKWQERIFCENGRWTNHVGRAFRTITDDSYDHGGHQYLTVVQGIALSDNILMAKLGIRLGPERLFRWETRFHFGCRIGISLPGEDAGIMLPRSRWSILGSCMSVPMGHEIAVTPLQMAMAHAAIANGGLWLPPRLIRRITVPDPMTGVPRDLALPPMPSPTRFFSPDGAAAIQAAMNHTMTEGTGKHAQLDGYISAGKTGTTEKLVDGHYSHQHHIGSFVCWAPAQPGVMPEVLALVAVDDPQAGGQYGAETAAPVVQAILQFSLEYLQVPKDPALEHGVTSGPGRHRQAGPVAQEDDR